MFQKDSLIHVSFLFGLICISCNQQPGEFSASLTINDKEYEIIDATADYRIMMPCSISINGAVFEGPPQMTLEINLDSPEFDNILFHAINAEKRDLSTSSTFEFKIPPRDYYDCYKDYANSIFREPGERIKYLVFHINDLPGCKDVYVKDQSGIMVISPAKGDLHNMSLEGWMEVWTLKPECVEVECDESFEYCQQYEIRASFSNVPVNYWQE